MIKRQPVSKVVMKNRVRSSFALLLSVVIFIFVLASVVIGLLTTPSTITPERGSRVFMLFTVNSNLVAAAGAVCVVPYAVDGLKKDGIVFQSGLTDFFIAEPFPSTLPLPLQWPFFIQEWEM